jgi:arylsulfatase B/arylsulfatase I/J
MHPEYGLYQALQRYITPYAGVSSAERRNLSAMVSALDEAAGNVTAALKRHGLWEKTLFIFSTDNGGPLPIASNFPLRGGKGSLWEGGVRGIGFVVAGDPGWLGVSTGGGIVDALIHVTDWMPTLCDPVLAACDMASPLGKTLDGVSAWSAISQNETGTRHELVHDVKESAQTALRVGRLKLLYNVRGGNGTAAKPSLYDVVADVGETMDLSADPRYATTLSEMQARVLFWLNESANVVDQASIPPDPRSNPANHGGNWLPWLPDNCSDFDCPPPHTPGPAPTPPNPAPSPAAGCMFTSNMDQYPAHSKGLASPDATSCCAACKTDATCSIAVFSKGSCYFKPAGAIPRPRVGSVSCKPSSGRP